MFNKIFFVSIALLFNIQNIYSQGTWFWQNPFPLGQNLNEVKLINQNTGIACGDNGAIIRTTNGGLTWKVNYIAQRNNLSEIYFVNQQTGFIAPGYTSGYIVSSYIQKTTNAGLNWEAKNTGAAIRYSGINFVNENTGYACGEFGSGTVIKTTNSGENWNVILNYATGFWDISFPDENTGYLLGDNSSILKTTNSGLNWFGVARVPVNNAESILFTDSITGYGVGGYSGFYKTTNGGMNWFSQGSFSGTKINFINQEKGWVVGDAGDIHITTNAGNNWYYFSMGNNLQTKSINFGDENNGIVVGDYGKIWKTNNGGFIWTLMSRSFTFNGLFGVSFVNTLTGFAMGSRGVFLKTTNSGINWTSSTIMSNWDLGHQQFLNENTGYMAADSFVFKGRLLKTNDGGNSWSSVYYVTNNYVTSTFFSDPENGFFTTTYALHDSGKILKTTNGGSNWQQVFKLSSAGLKGLYLLNQNTGFCSGDDGRIYKTTNAGNNWSPDIAIPVNSFFFTSPQIGFAVGINGSAYKTTDSGNNWLTLNTGVSPYYNLTKLYFNNDNTGYAIGNTTTSPVVSIIINTTNGGSAWTILDSTHFGGLYGITFSNPTSGYIVGNNGTILSTSNGGLTFSNTNTETLSKDIYLEQNYPNPFNPKTIIRYSLPTGIYVSLKVYDILGKQVAVLVDKEQNPGNYSVEFEASNLSNGIYFYRLDAGNISKTKKLLLLK